MNRGKGNLGQTLARMTREVSQMVEGANDEGGFTRPRKIQKRRDWEELKEGSRGRTSRKDHKMGKD